MKSGSWQIQHSCYFYSTLLLVVLACAIQHEKEIKYIRIIKDLEKLTLFADAWLCVWKNQLNLKLWIYERKHRRKILWTWIRQIFHRYHTQCTVHKIKISKLDFIKMKTSAFWKTLLREWENIPGWVAQLIAVSVTSCA